MKDPQLNYSSDSSQSYEKPNQSAKQPTSIISLRPHEPISITLKPLSKDDPLYFQRKIVAKSFCNRGFGLAKLRQELDESQSVMKVEKHRYKKMAVALAFEGYRRLELFLQKQCQRNIRPLTGVELRAITQPLLHCRQFLRPQYPTFLKFIKISYDLASVSITEEAAMKLYILIQNNLKGRIGQNQLDRVEDRTIQARIEKREMVRTPARYIHQRIQGLSGSSIWTKEKQKQLLQLYIQHSLVYKVRDTFNTRYGFHPQLSNVKKVKSRFFRIMRMSAHRLQSLYKKNVEQLPQLVNVNDDKIRAMLRLPYAVQTRRLLAQLYMEANPSIELLKKCVDEFNIFHKKREQEEIKIQKSAKIQPAIYSVNDKVRHNVKITRKILRETIYKNPKKNSKEEEVYFKQEDNSFQHIVSVGGEEKIHYYRKPSKPEDEQENESLSDENQRKKPMTNRRKPLNQENDDEIQIAISDQDASDIQSNQDE